MKQSIKSFWLSSLKTGTLILVLLGIMFFALSYQAYQRDVEKNKNAIRDKLLVIAKTAGAVFEREGFVNFFSPPSGTDWSAHLKNLQTTTQFKQYQEQLSRIIAAHSELDFDSNNMYMFVRNPADGRFYWALMAHPNPFAGQEYNPPESMRRFISSGHQGAATDFYFSEASGGRWMSAFAAVRSQDGRIAGVFEVAWEVERVLSELKSQATRGQLWTGILILAGVSLTILLLFFAARSDRMRMQLAMALKEAKRREEKLGKAQLYDALTGLPNKHYLTIRLETLVNLARSSGDYSYSVILLDLARFGRINSTYGPRIGDQLLIQVAKRIQELGSTHIEFIARFHGDNFCILLKRVHNPAVSRRLIDLVRDALRGNYPLQGRAPVFLDIAMGIVNGDPEYGSAVEVLRDAEAALHLAKSLDDEPLVTFDTTMQTDLASVVQLENDLRAALHKRELELFYQPIIHCQVEKGQMNCQVRSVEALLRWNHPRQGQIGPSTFIPMAEETGLILPIQEIVVKQAVQHFSQWHQARIPLEQVSVNISAKQLENSTLPADLQNLLEYNKLASGQVKLEITESLAMKNEARQMLAAISELGFEIAIDDFGTGYSSLKYLSDYPFHTIKLDKSFLDKPVGGYLSISDDDRPDPFAVAQAIIRMSQSLGKRVIAEGVENADQARALWAAGCREMQGYMIARPMPREAVADFVLEFNGKTGLSFFDPPTPNLRYYG